MGDKKANRGWVLKSSPTSGALKRSSSVEILLGTEPSLPTLVAPQRKTSGHVTHHKMNGSGVPPSGMVPSGASNAPTASVPSSAVPSSGAPSSGDPLMSASSTVSPLSGAPSIGVPSMGIPSSTVTSSRAAHILDAPIPDALSLGANLSNIPPSRIPPSNITPSYTPILNTPLLGFSSSRPNSWSVSPPNSLARRISSTSLPRRERETPIINEEIDTASPFNTTPDGKTNMESNSKVPQGNLQIVEPMLRTDQKPMEETPLNPATLVSNPVPNTTHMNPDNIPQRNPTGAINPPLTPKLRGKSQVTARIPPLNTKRVSISSPIGTPIIGARGHVFCVSTPEVDPAMPLNPPSFTQPSAGRVAPAVSKPLPLAQYSVDNGTATPPNPPLGQPTADHGVPASKDVPLTQPFDDKIGVAQCVGDPFTQRRKKTPPAEEDVVDGGGGEAAVWQRRLSQLFVPPTDTELNEEPEETCQLLPKISTPPLAIKVTPASPRAKVRGHIRGSREEVKGKEPRKGGSREEEEQRRRDSREEEQKRKNSKEEASRRQSKEEEKRKDSREEQKRRESREEEQRRESRDYQKQKDSRQERKRRESREEPKRRDSREESKRRGSRDQQLRRDSLEDSRRRDSQEEPPQDYYTGEGQRRDGDKRSQVSNQILKPKQSRIFFQDERKLRKRPEEADTDFRDILHVGKWSASNQRVGGRGEEKDNSKLKASLASSHNSLSSLIREKMGKSPIPATKKTRGELGLMVLVGVLFVVIVVGISLVTYFYNLHLLELSIFNRIKFLESPHHLIIYDPSGKAVLTSHLGENLPPLSIPEDCTHYLHYLHHHNYTLPHQPIQDEKLEDAEMVCLDWTGLAQLQLRKYPPEGDLQCYSVWWASLAEDFTLRDCLYVGEGYGAWWGGGEMTSGGYPVTNANVPLTRMITGKLGRDPWGQLLRHTWLSNTSSLLSLPEDFPGDVSINSENVGQICLEARPILGAENQAPTMSYKLCTASNLTSLIHHLHYEAVQKRKIVAQSAGDLVKHVVDPVKEAEQDEAKGTKSRGILREVFVEEVILRVKERLDQPVWIPWMTPDSPELTQDAVIAYVDSILSKDYGFWGHVLLPATWQATPGDLEFDSERFPDPLMLSETLAKKGFRLALAIHPFVSVEASAFNVGTREGLWVRQKDSNLPALATYDEKHPSVVTDFSNPRAKQWFSSKLNHINQTCNIDRFHLQPADAHALPTFHEYHMDLPGPDSVLVHFMAAVASVSPPLSTEGTVTPPLPPTFLSLGTGDGSWHEMETLVPRVLTMAMLGYSLVDIGPVGGLARAGHVPERELYIRWLEVATFMPAFQISILPHVYDQEVVDLALRYSKLRRSVVLPKYREKIPEAISKGTPLVTPLALFAPHDSRAALVDDEWMVGPDLLVAPITHRSQRARNIYLPEGIWKDEIDGHLRFGGRWLIDYKVPLTMTPHFTLKPIDDDFRH